MFTQFPYTNFQNLNLDYILSTIKNLNDNLDTEVYNALEKYLPTIMLNATYDPDTETITIGGSINV